LDWDQAVVAGDLPESPVGEPTLLPPLLPPPFVFPFPLPLPLDVAAAPAADDVDTGKVDVATLGEGMAEGTPGLVKIEEALEVVE
jgi:hypothetical protein